MCNPEVGNQELKHEVYITVGTKLSGCSKQKDRVWCNQTSLWYLLQYYTLVCNTNMYILYD